MEELKSRIVSLNTAKNNYACKKLKGEEVNDKELISSLIYVISECRRVGSDIGISDDGKINREDPAIEIFRHLNQNVKDLKDQIISITKSSPSELKEIIRNERDKNSTLNTQNEKEPINQTTTSRGKDEKSRQKEMREHLRNKLEQNKDTSQSDNIGN
jgi:hypothetical protein